MTTPTETDCLFCIDGITIGESPTLGRCFQICPHCQPLCRCCGGRGAYPVWTRHMTELAAFFKDHGLCPVLCHTCGGVIGTSRLDPEDDQ
jgi:hypothetical protein